MPASATAFQLNFSWIPVATPTPWLAIEPTIPPIAPAAISAPAPTPVATVPPNTAVPRIVEMPEATLPTDPLNAASAAPEVTTVTAIATTARMIAPKTPHLFFFGAWGFGVLGVTSPIASAGL